MGAELETQGGEVISPLARGRPRAIGLASALAVHERTGSFDLCFPLLVSIPEVGSDTPSIVLHELGRDERARILLGRSLEDDIFVKEVTVSRRHAALERRGTSWSVSDLGSMNGTFVDGRRLEVGVAAPLVPAKTTVRFGLAARFLLADEAWLSRHLEPIRTDTRRLGPVREEPGSPVHDYLVASILESLKESRATVRRYRVARTGARVDLVVGWEDLVRFVEGHADDVVAVEALPADGLPRIAYERCDGRETPSAPVKRPESL